MTESPNPYQAPAETNGRRVRSSSEWADTKEQSIRFHFQLEPNLVAANTVANPSRFAWAFLIGILSLGIPLAYVWFTNTQNPSLPNTSVLFPLLALWVVAGFSFSAAFFSQMFHGYQMFKRKENDYLKQPVSGIWTAANCQVQMSDRLISFDPARHITQRNAKFIYFRHLRVSSPTHDSNLLLLAIDFDVEHWQRINDDLDSRLEEIAQSPRKNRRQIKSNTLLEPSQFTEFKSLESPPIGAYPVSVLHQALESAASPIRSFWGIFLITMGTASAVVVGAKVFSYRQEFGHLPIDHFGNFWWELQASGQTILFMASVTLMLGSAFLLFVGHLCSRWLKQQESLAIPNSQPAIEFYPDGLIAHMNRWSTWFDYSVFVSQQFGDDQFQLETDLIKFNLQRTQFRSRADWEKVNVLLGSNSIDLQSIT